MELKKIGLLWCLLGINTLLAQVKIGENPNTIDQASILELESTNRALVISRVSADQMEAIVPLPGALVFNTTVGCVFYFDGGAWNNLCTTTGTDVSFEDNGDGTFTIDVGDGPVTFNGAPETTSTLVENPDGSFLYTDETGAQTPIPVVGAGGGSIVDNGDGTYTIDFGSGPVTFDGAPETTSTLVENPDGSFLYTDETGAQTPIPAVGTGGGSIIDNGDGTYTIDFGSGPVTFDGAPETTSTLETNPDGSFTYTDETGTETTIPVSGGGLTGTAGSVFFASDTGAPTENNTQLFWDNVNERLGIGTNTPNNELDVNGLTRSLRVQAGAGTVGFPGFHFTNNSNSGMLGVLPGEMGLVASGRELIRLSSDERVGILVTNPQATLHVGGDLIVDGTITTPTGSLKAQSKSPTKSIRKGTGATITLETSDDTIILDQTVTLLQLPDPDPSNKGHVFIVKDLGGAITRLNMPYRDDTNTQVYEIDTAKVLWLQSDGAEWQQIN